MTWWQDLCTTDILPYFDRHYNFARWWFHIFFIFTPNLGEDSHFAATPRFAGPDNFCPVLVGSLGGALFGCNPDLLEGDECNDGNLALPRECFLK